MESGDIAKVLLGVLALCVVLGKSFHYLLSTLVTSQVDRLIDAGVNNNANADERHIGNQKSLKKVTKALKRLKRKKCSAKPFQDGPPGHPEAVPKRKARPTKAK